MQNVMALLIWFGTIALAGVLVWSAASRNVQLRTAGACTPCDTDFYPVGPAECPRICVARSLEQDIDAKCTMPSSEALALRKAENLATITAPEDAESLEVRRLEGASLKKEVYMRLGDSPALSNKTLMQLLASPEMLPAFLPLILVVSVAWFVTLRKAAHISMWSTFVLFLGGLGYGYYLTQNWVMLLILGVIAVSSGGKYKSINQGCHCLQVGLRALSESPASLFVIIATAVLLLVYTGMLVTSLVFTSQIFRVSVNDTGACNLETVSSMLGTVFVLLFMLTSSFLTMVASFAISFAIGCWYFHNSDGAAPAMPIVTGFKLALLSRNGTGVCAQAAAVMTVVEYMEKKVKKTKCPCLDPLWCFLLAMSVCFTQCLASLCAFAVVAVALDGGPFCETSRRARATIGNRRALRFLAVDASLSWILRLQAHALSTIICIAAWAAVDASEDLGIFSAIASGTRSAGDIDPKLAQWIVVLVVFLFFWFMRRPLFTVTLVSLVYIFAGDFITSTLVNSALAALLVGGIGSLVLHQFADAAMGSLIAMLYCWSLDEAVGVGGGLPGAQRCRQQVALFWEDSVALAPSAPPLAEVAAGPPLGEEGTISVQCPLGVAPGSLIQVVTPNGQAVQLPVPRGVQPGEVFQARI